MLYGVPQNGKTLPADGCDCFSPTILERTPWGAVAISRRVWEGNPEFSNRKWLLPCRLRRGFREQQKRVTWILWVLPRNAGVMSSEPLQGWECSCAVLCLVDQSCPTLWDPMGCSPPGSSVHGILQARILEWVASALLQGIFPTQGLNPGLLYCRQILYSLSHQGRPKTLEWVAYPFSRRSSQPRNWTGISCTAGGFFFFFFLPAELPGNPGGVHTEALIPLPERNSMAPVKWDCQSGC